MDERLIIGASVHVLGTNGYEDRVCRAGIVVAIFCRGERIDIYCLPYTNYKNTDVEGVLLLDVMYNPSVDVVGSWHWPTPTEPLCRGYV